MNPTFFRFLKNFLLIIPFTYISNYIPLHSYLSTSPTFHNLPLLLPFASMKVPTTPTDLLLLHPSSISLHWSLKLPQDLEPPFPLISDKGILCYIYIWSPVHSLVGGLIPGSTGWPSQLTFFL